MYLGLAVKCLLFVSDVNQNLRISCVRGSLFHKEWQSDRQEADGRLFQVFCEDV
jgi:hypothetical protein